jgi:competence protein ComEC
VIAAARAEPPAPDLRLVVPALACWAAAAAAPVMGVRACLGAGCVLTAVLTVALLARARRPALGLLLAIGCLAAVGGLAAASGRIVARQAGPLPRLARAGVDATVDVVLTADPHLSATGKVLVATARAEVLSVRGRTWRLRQPVLVLLPARGWPALLPGQRVRVEARLRAADPDDTVSAVLLTRGAPLSVGPPSPLGRAAGAARAGLRAAAAPLPIAEAGLLPGLVDGDVSRLPRAVSDDFRQTGLTHLVAVSGENCVAVLAAVLGLMRLLRVPPRPAAGGAALALLGFVVLARPSPSVLRAAVMGLLVLAGRVLGRDRPALSVLAFAVVLLVLADPDLARAPGFALSVGACLGLIVLAPRWSAALCARGWPPSVADAVAIPASAQVACTPVLVLLAAGVSPIAVPANMLAVPVVAWATVAGLVAAVTAPWCLPLAHGAAWLAAPACWWMVGVAHVGAQVPGATLPWPGGPVGLLLLAALTGLAVLLVRHRSGRRS